MYNSSQISRLYQQAYAIVGFEETFNVRLINSLLSLDCPSPNSSTFYEFFILNLSSKSFLTELFLLFVIDMFSHDARSS